MVTELWSGKKIIVRTLLWNSVTQFQSDNTLMDFGLWLNLESTKDSPGQLGSEVVIELKKITRKSTCFESINLR